MGDIHMDKEAFGERVQSYLRSTGYSQQNLADALGLHPGVLSRKLHGTGNAYLTQMEVRLVISTLAHWNAITTQAEAIQLLELAHLKQNSIPAKAWQTPPLSQLEAKQPLPATAGGATPRVAPPALPQASQPSPLHNLPAHVTRLIGREWAVERLLQLLGRDEARLVTLVGPGGCGKTRLALHVASELVETFADGAWLVNLAEVRNPALVPMSILQVFGGMPAADIPPMQSLVTYVRDKHLLLVLDNFEQVGEAAPVVSELLAAAPGLKILVTSRVVLHTYGEHEFSVPTLDVPGLDVLSHTSLLAEYSAIELFLERVQAVRPNLTLNAENGVSIAQICARLDGLPLALELAAVRTKVMPPEQLLERILEEPFSLLTGGAKGLPRKQQTLRNTFEWSYHLLSPIEQQCFARLGIFTGSWSLEAAKAVMQVGRGVAEQEPPLVAGSYLDILEQLVDSSLLVQQPTVGGQVRFTMLETLREYARERLAALGELEKLRDWHVRYYLGVAEAATAGLHSESSLLWQARLLAEQQNLRAALEWSSQRARDRTTTNDPSISAARTMEELSETASIRNALIGNASTR